MYPVKYNPTGQVAWAQSVTVSGNIYSTGISADAQGNVYITGNTTSDTLVFGTDTAFTFSTSATSNIFVAVYNMQGHVKWVRNTQNNNNVASAGISAGNAGNLFVTGWFGTPSVNIGNNTLVNSDTLFQSQALFIAEYNAEGNMVWLGGGLTARAAVDAAASVQVDNKGHLYVSGSYAGPGVNIERDTLPFNGVIGSQSNIFIANYDITETSINIDNITATSGLIIYPNPSAGRFYFKGITAGGKLNIYNVLGQQIYSGLIADETMFNISEKAKGIYLYQLVNDGAVKEGKIVIE